LAPVASQNLPEIAKICNSKRFVDTDGKHVRENKREAKPLKGAEKRKWVKRKLDLMKMKIAFQFPSV
jgi:hypothetical protein